MKRTNEEKMNILLEAGAERFPKENWVTIPFLGRADEFSKNLKLFEASKFQQTETPYEDMTISGHYLDDLLRFSMYDDSMYPELFPNDILHIAFRAPVESGNTAAVMVEGADDKVRIRKIRYRDGNTDLIPVNDDFPVETYAAERVTILGLMSSYERPL